MNQPWSKWGKHKSNKQSLKKLYYKERDDALAIRDKEELFSALKKHTSGEWRLR